MLGKLIGGFAGYSLGGFFGLLIGLFLGNLFDRAVPLVAGGYVLRGLNKFHAQTQQAFFEATFSVMGHVAKADGRVTQEEIGLARHIMARMGLSKEAEREAMSLFDQGKQADFDLEAAVQKLRRSTTGRHGLLQMFIEIQMGAAYADGTLDPAEREILLKICSLIGLSANDFERLNARIQAEMHHQKAGKDQGPTLEDAYAILNIKEAASDAEVKRAYRRLTSQHHPDKLEAKGLPKEMMKLAQEKTFEIRTAYERIRDHRGFK